MRPRRRDRGQGPAEQWAPALETHEVGAQVRRRRVAQRDVLRHRGEHDAVERARYAGFDARRRHRFLAHVLVRDRHRAVGGERRDPGEHLVEHDAEGVHVGATVEREALGLFRREVGGGAEHCARLGERVAALGAGDAEVGDLHPALRRDEHVSGLHVAVDDAVAVRELERVGDVGRDPGRFHRRERAVSVEHVAERLPVDVLHHDEGRVVLLAPVVHRDDVRVVQARGRLRFTAEPLDERRVGRERR